MDGDLRFVEVHGTRVGYQTHGSGDIDIVYSPGLASHLDMTMEQPRYRHFVEGLTQYGRVIRFDRRGTGISDSTRADTPGSWELWVDDLTAVLDDAASAHAVLVATNDAGAPGLLFAASQPSRIRALVLFNTTARFTSAPDYPEGHPPEVIDLVAGALREMWGTEASVGLLAPSLQADAPFSRWYTRFQRAACTPTAMADSILGILHLDARHVLSEIHCPTLVMHRSDYTTVPPAQGRFLAEHIADAEYVEIPGTDAPIYTQGLDDSVARIGAFLGASPRPADDGRQFATVLFSDIVSSTERAAAEGDSRWHRLLDAHDTASRGAVSTWGGKFIKSTGDGILATFDSPSRAIHAAIAIREDVGAVGLDVCLGLHAGPIIVRQDGDVGGLAVHAAARVMSKAGPGEVLVSDSVAYLVAEPNITFEERGRHELKGLPEPVELFAALTNATPRSPSGGTSAHASADS